MEKQNSLSASTAWYSLGNFFVRSISFILIPLYSNFLTTGEYGNYALLMSLYALIAVFYQSGMQSGLTKFYLEVGQVEQRSKVFSTVFNSVIMLGFFLSIVLIAFAQNISALLLGSGVYKNLIVLLSVSLFTDTLGYFALQLLKTKEKAKKVVQLSGISALVNLALNIILVYYLKWKIEGILWAQLGSSLILILILLPSILPELRLSIDKTFLKKLIIFSLPLMVSGLFASAVDVSDRFILDIFTTKNEVGIYSLSYKIALVMNVFVISFRTAWAPYGLNLFYKNEYTQTFGLTLKKYIAASCLILLVITLFAHYLFEINIAGFSLVNKSYESGLIILPFVLMGYLFNGLASFYSIYSLASSKSYHFLISDGLAFIINIGLNFLLIPIFGMLGAAISTTAAFIAASFYLFAISFRKIKVDYPLKEIIITLAAAVLILFAGMAYKVLVFEIILIISYVIIVWSFAKVKLTGFFS